MLLFVPAFNTSNVNEFGRMFADIDTALVERRKVYFLCSSLLTCISFGSGGLIMSVWCLCPDCLFTYVEYARLDTPNVRPCREGGVLTEICTRWNLLPKLVECHRRLMGFV